MNADAIEELLARFTNSLRLEGPLDVSEPADAALYVEGLHGNKDAVGRLRKDILRVEGGGVFLFSGQAGSGKSTELQRLRRDVAQRGCKAYYCDLLEWLNLSEPIARWSFLVALLSSWVDQLGTLHGQRSPAERLVVFFKTTRLIPENLKLDAGAGPIKAQIQFALQSDEDFRREIETALRRQLSSIVAQAHRFVAELKAELCPHGEKCVLLADSIEKLAGYGDDEARKVADSVLRLFVSEGAALKLPGVHVVHSVSPFLLAQNNQLPATLGTGVVVNMPSVHIDERHCAAVDAGGLASVVQLVDKRFADWRRVFTEQQLQRLALQTGGDLRDFLRAIRIALTDDIESLPIDDAALDYALGQVSPSKAIPAEHVAWLARVERTHEAELSAAIDGAVLQRYLSTKHVLLYLNDETWYAVHPLLRDWVRQRGDAAPAAAAA